MANTLTITDIAPIIYNAMSKVAREVSGAINSVLINSGSERASASATVKSFVTGKATLQTSLTPAMTIPATDDDTVGSATMTLDKVAMSNIPIVGETALALSQGAGYERVLEDLIAQRIRIIVNAIETEICSTAYKGASRAWGTAGTAPFGSNFNELAVLRKIFTDSGVPVSDGQLSCVVDTFAGSRLRQLATLQKASEAGGTDLLRQGELLNLMGFSIKESAQIASHTKGTGTGGRVNNVSAAIGDTDVPVENITHGGTGYVVGDVFVLTGDTGESGVQHKYVITGGPTTTSATGTIVLGRPGLRTAPADDTNITIGNNYVANLALHRNGVELAMRAPAQPPGGDAATDTMVFRDEKTGLVFDVTEYKGYRMNRIEIAVRYGVKVWNSDHVAILLG